MLGILWNILSIFRFFGIWLDGLAFSFVDNAYNLITIFSNGTFLKQEFVIRITKNLYVLIGIFALFKMALLLINSIINPDKLLEKGKGASSVFINFFMVFVLLIVTPIIFNEAIELQKVVVNGNYIQKIFLNSGSLEKAENPGKAMQDIAISALITPNDEAVKMKENGKCSKNCNKALEDYEKMRTDGFSFLTIEKHIGVTVKNDEGRTIFVYNYPFLIPFITGIFITYILISFSFDIARRMIEMTVLQVVAPLFIVTYIDPKSGKDGPFKKWLTTCGKTYVSLFLKLGAVSLMLLLLSILGNRGVYSENLKLGGNPLAVLVLLFAILIFVKKMPDWISSMIGMGEGGLGELGIGKKLGGAALVGEGITQGIADRKQRRRERNANRKAAAKDTALRSVGAGIQGAKDSYENSSQSNNTGTYAQRARNKANNMMQAIRAGGTAAAAVGAAARMENSEKYDNRMFKNAKDGINAGREMVDPGYQSSRQKKLDKIKGEANVKLQNAGLDDVTMREKRDNAKDIKEAYKLYPEDKYPNLVKNNIGPDGKLNKDNLPLNVAQLNNACKGRYTDREELCEKLYKKMYPSADVEHMDKKEIVQRIESNSALKGLVDVALQQNVISAGNEYTAAVERRSECVQQMGEMQANMENFLKQNMAPLEYSYLPTDETRTESIMLALGGKDSDKYKFYQSLHEEFESQNNIYDSLSDSIKNIESNVLKEDGTTKFSVNPAKDDPLAVTVNGKIVNKLGIYDEQKDGTYKFNPCDTSEYFPEIDTVQQKKKDKLQTIFDETMKGPEKTEGGK